MDGAESGASMKGRPRLKQILNRKAYLGGDWCS
jgi:hypothetical protein